MDERRLAVTKISENKMVQNQFSPPCISRDLLRLSRRRLPPRRSLTSDSMGTKPDVYSFWAFGDRRLDFGACPRRGPAPESIRTYPNPKKYSAGKKFGQLGKQTVKNDASRLTNSHSRCGFSHPFSLFSHEFSHILTVSH